MPIGRNHWIKTDEKGLIAKTEYASKEANPFAHQVYTFRKEVWTFIFIHHKSGSGLAAVYWPFKNMKDLLLLGHRLKIDGLILGSVSSNEIIVTPSLW